jgi:hypothetical protein
MTITFSYELNHTLKVGDYYINMNEPIFIKKNKIKKNE